jgi:uncharacterized membrane protein YfcA
MEALTLSGVAAAAFAASGLAAVVGFGGAIILLPVLVAVAGPRDAIVILTVAQLAGNGSRVVFNRHEVDRGLVGWFALGAVPAAIAGGVAFAALPAGPLTRLLGAFMLASVAWRHVRRGAPRRPSRRSFGGLGAVFGFLSAVLGSVGPLLAPFFLAYGLVKGAYIGTEAAATVVMHVTKIATYGGASVLARDAVAGGLALAPVMVAGSWAGTRVLDRLPEPVFVTAIEVVLVVAGLIFLIEG